MSPASARRPDRSGAFTLIELMVSMAILSLMLVLVFQMLDETQKTWSRAKGMVSSFKDARIGYEAMNRNISQATLNAYLGYELATNGTPRSFERKSELHFVCGRAKDLLSQPEGRRRITHCIFFQAPLGYQTIDQQSGSSKLDKYSQMDQLLNGWGYYVEYGSDKPERPPFLSSLDPPVPERYRFRLMEFRQPAEATVIYQYQLDATAKPKKSEVMEWFASKKFGVDSDANLDPVASAGQIKTTRPIADNIIALIVSPRLSENDTAPEASSSSTYKFSKPTDIAPKYYYNTRAFQVSDNDVTKEAQTFSRHQIPPVIRVTLVAVDEVDASRFAAQHPDTKELPGYAPDDSKDMFSSVKDYGKDLAFLQESLTAVGIRHRVFTSNIRMREGNFSRTR